MSENKAVQSETLEQKTTQIETMHGAVRHNEPIQVEPMRSAAGQGTPMQPTVPQTELPSSEIYLRASDVSCGYAGKAVLSGVSLDVSAGDIPASSAQMVWVKPRYSKRCSVFFL